MDNNVQLANQMGTFFVQKIETIGSKLDKMALGLPSLSDDHTSVSPATLSKFNLLSEEEARKLISSSPKKSCTLELIPTSLVMDCIDVLLPIATKMINLSLESGLLTDDWKCAIVLPLLKKLGLDLLTTNVSVTFNIFLS